MFDKSLSGTALTGHFRHVAKVLCLSRFSTAAFSIFLKVSVRHGSYFFHVNFSVRHGSQRSHFPCLWKSLSVTVLTGQFFHGKCSSRHSSQQVCCGLPRAHVLCLSRFSTIASSMSLESLYLARFFLVTSSTLLKFSVCHCSQQPLVACH